MEASFSSSHGSPPNSISSIVQASEWTAQSFNMGQTVLSGDLDVVHEDRASFRSSEGVLAGDGWSFDSFPLSLEDETFDFHVMSFGSSPNDESVSDWAVGDPGLATVEDVSIRSLVVLGDGFHAIGVRAVVGLGETETADFSATCQVRNVLSLLFICSVGADGPHHQGRLDRKSGSDDFNNFSLNRFLFTCKQSRLAQSPEQEDRK